MNKALTVVVIFHVLVCLSFQASAQETPSQKPDGTGPVEPQVPERIALQAASESPSGNCAQYDAQWELLYPAIGASYVGGSIPNMPMSPGTPLRWVLLRARQFRINGQFALANGCLLFSFKAENHDRYAEAARKKKSTKLKQLQAEELAEHLNDNYRVLKCSNNVNLSKKNQSCKKADSNPKAYVVVVPYAKVIVLSRAKYTTSDLTSVSTAYATVGGGILTAIAGSVHRTAAKERALGIAAGALVLYWYFAVADPRLGDNYIAVFVKKQPPRLAPPASPDIALNGSLTINPQAPQDSKSFGITGNAAINQAPKSDELFKEGDVVMFRIPNHHDYYNISMILSAEKGLTFVSESAEKTVK